MQASGRARLLTVRTGTVSGKPARNMAMRASLARWLDGPSTLPTTISPTACVRTCKTRLENCNTHLRMHFDMALTRSGREAHRLVCDSTGRLVTSQYLSSYWAWHIERNQLKAVACYPGKDCATILRPADFQQSPQEAHRGLDAGLLQRGLEDRRQQVVRGRVLQPAALGLADGRPQGADDHDVVQAAAQALVRRRVAGRAGVALRRRGTSAGETAIGGADASKTGEHRQVHCACG